YSKEFFMGRSMLFDNLARAMRIALFCEKEKISTSEGLERVEEAEYKAARLRASRREFMANMGKFAAAGALVSVAEPVSKAFPRPGAGTSVSVGIVGAGLAGLTCAT